MYCHVSMKDMREIGSMTELAEQENYFMLMVISTLGSGKMTRPMVKGNTFM